MATKLTHAPNGILREMEIGDQVLLFDPIQDCFHAINLAGKIIWLEAKRGTPSQAYAKTIASFFGGQASDYQADVEAAVKAFTASGIFVPADSKSIAPVSREIDMEPHGHPLTYERPEIRTYPADWMKTNHPSAFLSVKFSDTWSPACDK
ncbi:hypothetical protein [Achromobacter xylosoxidans]|uniref:hypothetical protein n=1 Tax=Alcaligenes xylosoxydans xylosoxydans TaxID=85698 RepID=UPI0011789AA7|nr:hypothetical protein [Achromobacter xylosoxidans]